MLLQLPHQRLVICMILAWISLSTTWAFHDCIEASARIRQQRRRRLEKMESSSYFLQSPCAGGICVGMANGPHQGGNASYPVAWNGTSGTSVHSTMTVPKLPLTLDDSLTYYLWTDVFFGDASLGQMNQFVPQLLLGNVLDGSSGPPLYKPHWNYHDTWVFGAHYFFETLNTTTNQTEAHAAYGKLYPAVAGETLYSIFTLRSHQHADKVSSSRTRPPPPAWVLTMGVVGDVTRVSTLVVDHPYMGMGAHWKDSSTTSWLEPFYKNMCINACWEIYGATDTTRLPSNGSQYHLTIQQPVTTAAAARYPFTTWERDEGNGVCPSAHVSEQHTTQTQHVQIDIAVSSNSSSSSSS